MIPKKTVRKKVQSFKSAPEYKLQSKANEIYRLIKPNMKGRIISINNNSANAIKGAKNKKMGVLPGVSDMILLLDNMQVVWIEWKTQIGRQSRYQIAFENMLCSIQHHYHIVRSMTEFIAVLEKYEHLCQSKLKYELNEIIKP